MKSIKTVNKEKISHLENCLEQLKFKENEQNELDIRYLSKIIYNTLDEMKTLNDEDSLNCFHKNINNDIRELLMKLDIELMV